VQHKQHYKMLDISNEHSLVADVYCLAH